jgi:dimethylglycine dehydrogenase
VQDEFSWHRSTDFDSVAAEVRAVRADVGLLETTGFAKYSVNGAGAEGWLDRLLACRLPRPGRMVLAPMLKEDGRLIGDFTLANLGAEGYLIIGSGAAEEYHRRWFEQHLPSVAPPRPVQDSAWRGLPSRAPGPVSCSLE